MYSAHPMDEVVVVVVDDVNMHVVFDATMFSAAFHFCAVSRFLSCAFILRSGSSAHSRYTRQSSSLSRICLRRGRLLAVSRVKSLPETPLINCDNF